MSDLVSIQRKKRPAPEEDSFEDQVLFFNQSGGDGREVQRRIAAARVVIFGAGAVGAQTFDSLAESGLGSLRVVDDTQLTDAEVKAAALSNGGAKRTRAEALTARATKTAGARQSFGHVPVDLDSDAEVARAVEGADCALVCIDAPAPALLRAVNRAALKTGTPWLAGQIYGGLGVVGPTVVPGESACYQCYELWRDAHLPNAREVVQYETRLSEMSAIRNPRAAPRPLATCLAGLVALEALRLVTRQARPQTVGRFLRVQFFEPEMTYHPIIRLPGCPACGRLP